MRRNAGESETEGVGVVTDESWLFGDSENLNF